MVVAGSQCTRVLLLVLGFWVRYSGWDNVAKGRELHAVRHRCTVGSALLHCRSHISVVSMFKISSQSPDCCTLIEGSSCTEGHTLHDPSSLVSDGAKPLRAEPHDSPEGFFEKPL